jgi:hypothetical protein
MHLLGEKPRCASEMGKLCKPRTRVSRIYHLGINIVKKCGRDAKPMGKETPIPFDLIILRKY